MAGTNPAYGPVAVGLYALHDREFFAELLKDPRPAIQRKVKEGKLKIDNRGIDEVVKLLAERARRPDEEYLRKWDDWKARGTWDPVEWPAEWSRLRPPTPPIPPRPVKQTRAAADKTAVKRPAVKKAAAKKTTAKKTGKRKK